MDLGLSLLYTIMYGSMREGSDSDSWKVVGGMSLDIACRTCQQRAEQYDVRAEMLIAGGRVQCELGPCSMLA